MNSYSISHTENMATIIFNEIRGLKHVTDIFDSLFNDAGFRQHNLLVDLSEHKNLNFDLIDVEQLVTYFKSHRRKLENKLFAIVAVDDYAYGLSRMWETMKDFEMNVESSVFRQKNAAEEWLSA